MLYTYIYIYVYTYENEAQQSQLLLQTQLAKNILKGAKAFSISSRVK